MQHLSIKPASGHVYRVERKRGAVWFAKYRLPQGRQVQRKLGPAWQARGRPADGHFTKATAEAELRRILGEADSGKLPGMVRTGRTFDDAADAWLAYVEHHKGIRPSTLYTYTSTVKRHLRPAFGKLPVEQVTSAMIENLRDAMLAKGCSPATVNKTLVMAHGVFGKARKLYGLPSNPVARDDVERVPERRSGALDYYSPEEVHKLCRHADSEQDAALFLTAAFSGLRLGELRALRWGAVDFEKAALRVEASYTLSTLGPPKSGKVRSVPMVEPVAQALAKLGNREDFAGRDDLVFPGIVGEYLDASALRRRYKDALTRAELRPLRLHDLRHSFASIAVSRMSLVDVQAYMGHADIQTTARYLHHKARNDEARVLNEAFAPEPLPEEAVRPAA